MQFKWKAEEIPYVCKHSRVFLQEIKSVFNSTEFCKPLVEHFLQNIAWVLLGKWNIFFLRLIICHPSFVAVIDVTEQKPFIMVLNDPLLTN